MANPDHIKVLKRGVRTWNAWRERNHLKLAWKIDLSGADLSDMALDGVDFNCVNLTGTILTRATLKHACLVQAKGCGATFLGVILSGADLLLSDFSGADFSVAQMDCTNMAGAKFCHADFTGADLTVANIGDADMSGAVFTDVEISGAIFGGTCLKGSIDLENCRHSGPSIIDMRTLEVSGMLPEKFLRGCGIREELINYLPSFLNRPIQFYSCFISYSHEDKAFARLLHDRLQGQGIRCWLDEHQLLPGDDIHDKIDQGIRLWDKVLLCASEISLKSWWVDGEINRAFQKEAQLMKERNKKVLTLIPLNLDGFLFSGDYQSGKKSEIKSRLAANFVNWENDNALFDRELEKVIRALKTDDAGREKPPISKL